MHLPLAHKASHRIDCRPNKHRLPSPRSFSAASLVPSRRRFLSWVLRPDTDQTSLSKNLLGSVCPGDLGRVVLRQGSPICYTRSPCRNIATRENLRRSARYSLLPSSAIPGPFGSRRWYLTRKHLAAR